MTNRQIKLVENYIRKVVRKTLNENLSNPEYKITRTDRVFPYQSYELKTDIEGLKKSGWQIDDDDMNELEEKGVVYLTGGSRGDKIKIEKIGFK